MVSEYLIISEDFDAEIVAIKALIGAFSEPQDGNPRARVAAANAAILLLAAAFEEFIREMARAYMRSVVMACPSAARLPPKLVSLAWRRTMESLAAMKPGGVDGISSEALSRFKVIYEFCNGDLSQDIYRDLVHNENNMRPNELNGLFKVGGLKNVCLLVCDCEKIATLLDEVDPNVANGLLVSRMESFFDRRNQTAHALNAVASSGPALILKDVEFLAVFAAALTETLEKKALALSNIADLTVSGDGIAGEVVAQLETSSGAT